MTTTQTQTQTQTNDEIHPIPRVPVGGTKELKARIQEYVTLVTKMKNDFDCSVNSPEATVDPAPICVPLHEFHSSQCAVRHRDFIRKNGRESQALCIPETNVNSTLTALEKFRKMLVTNKQHRKTAHTCNHRVATAIQASFQTTMDEIEPPMNAFSVELLKIDDATKQHHRTMSRNILEEVNRLLVQLRGQFIVAYQTALDDAVGKIIQHAEESREFIERTRQLALLEFCASRWFHSQKDAMDQNDYFVCINETVGGGRTIQIHTFQDREEIFVATFDLDEEFSNQIMTEESIMAFEWADQTLVADKDDARERYANYEREQTQFYTDQTNASAAIEMMDDIDNDSDYDPDTYWG